MKARDEAIEILASLLHMQPANGTLGRLVDCIAQAAVDWIKAERQTTLALPAKKAQREPQQAPSPPARSESR